MTNKAESPAPDTWRNFFVVRPARCKGNCQLVDGAGITCCHSCGWDDWFSDANPIEERNVVGAGNSSDSQIEKQ